MKKLIIISLLLITTFSFAAEERAMIKGIRPMGMGGAFTAISDDENAFFYNPAGITQRQRYFLQIFSLDLGLNKDGYESGRFLKDNYKDLKKFDNLTNDKQISLLNKINDDIAGKTSKVSISLPSLTYISAPIGEKLNYFSYGAGLFAYADADIKFNKSLFVPSLSYKAQMTGIVAVPFAYRITTLDAIGFPGQLSLGTNLKYIYRNKAQENNISVAEFDDYKLPFHSGSAFAMDFGAIYHINPRWNFGVQVADIINTGINYGEFKDKFEPELNIGIAYKPRIIYYFPHKYFITKNRITFALDITDMTNADETLSDSFHKKTHMGAEYKMSYFALRAGFNSGYPTAGLGIGSDLVQVEYAFYGEEMGIYAGQMVSWMHRVLLSVKLGRKG